MLTVPRKMWALWCMMGAATACGVEPEGQVLLEPPSTVTRAAIVDGTRDRSNQFDYVVQIGIMWERETNPWRRFWQGDHTGSCSATALSSSILLTAAHCVYNPADGGLAEYLWVRRASGANGASQGATSTAIVLHDNWFESFTGDEYDTTLVRDDWALVLFGEGTFARHAALAGDDVPPGELAVTVVGYAGSRKRRYRQLDGAERSDDGDLIWAQDVAQKGDSGGPWLYHTGTEYRVLGVTSGDGDGVAYGACLSPSRAEATGDFLGGVDDYCVTGYEHVNFRGRSWSFCHRSALMEAFGDFTAQDSFSFHTAWKYSDWNDKFSSVWSGHEVRTILYRHACHTVVATKEIDANLRDDGAGDNVSCVGVQLVQ